MTKDSSLPPNPSVPNPKSEVDVSDLFAEELTRDAQLLVDHAIARYIEELPEYAGLLKSEGHATLSNNLRGHFHVVCNVARDTKSGENPQYSVVAYSASAERAGQGFPLDALLRSSQIVTHIVWDWLMDNSNFGASREAVIRRCWPIWLGYAEHLARDAAAAYLAVARERAQQDSTFRRNVVEQLINGRLTNLEAHRSMREMGFDETKPFRIALLRWWDLPDGESFEVIEQSRRLAEGALRHVFRVQPLTTARDHTVIMLAQYHDSESGLVQEQLRHITTHPSNRRFQISGAVSDPVNDLSEVHKIHAQLLHSASVGRHEGSILFTSDVSLLDHAIGAVHDSFSRICPQDLKQFVRENVKSVALWQETLEALASHNLSVREAAAALHVHPNTVYYRLNQISILSKRDTNTLQGMLDVLIVLRLRSQIGLAE